MTSADDHDRAALIALLAERSFKRGEFTLSSGKPSRIYFNLKTTMLHPRGADLCARLLLARLDRLDFDYVSGLEMGAVPLLGAVAALSAGGSRPVFATFVRKAAKDHGTRVMVEGLDALAGETLDGKRVALIDDVATSGAAMLKAAEEIRTAGGHVADALVIVDRQEGAADRLAGAGITLHALATAADLGVTSEDRAPL